MTDNNKTIVEFNALREYLKMFPNEYVISNGKRIKYVSYHEQLRINDKYIVEDELAYIGDCYTGSKITGQIYVKLDIVGEKELSVSQKKNILNGINKDELKEILNTMEV